MTQSRSAGVASRMPQNCFRKTLIFNSDVFVITKERHVDFLFSGKVFLMVGFFFLKINRAFIKPLIGNKFFFHASLKKIAFFSQEVLTEPKSEPSHRGRQRHFYLPRCPMSPRGGEGLGHC